MIFVLIGVALLSGRGRFYPIRIISPAIVLGFVVFTIYNFQGGDILHKRDIDTIKINQAMPEEKATGLKVEFSSGRVKIYEQEENFISGSVTTPSGISLMMSAAGYERENLYEIQGDMKSEYVFSPWDNNNSWEIAIGKNRPVNLDVKTKYSSDRIEAENLVMSDLNYAVSWGSGEIILGKAARKVDIEAVGSRLVIMIPWDSGLRIYSDLKFSKDNLDDLELGRSYKEYKNSNYDKSSDRVDLNLDTLLSIVEIKFY
ncbi:MAG: hypothetical protein PHI66_02415 [Candidatus Pacebacteria bacterium]|nr:hypothetical protein [Candidatus Paceibacterota bacterium]